MAEYTTVELGSHEYKLRYDLNAICDIEDGLGVEFGELAEQTLSAKALRVMLWAGLKKFHPDMTPEDVGGLIAMYDLETLGGKLNEAMGGDRRGNSPAGVSLESGTGPTPSVSATASSD